MHLTAANLVHFLADYGRLEAKEIVAGQVAVLDASRRNRNFKELRNGAAGLFVKQMRDAQSDAMLTLKREAACYEVARDDAALSRLMPRLVRYDESRHVIVVELLPDAESLLERHSRQGFSIDIGRMLGEGLGLYHTRAGALLENEKLKQLLTRHTPVTLTLERGGHAALARITRIGPALSALIQQHNRFETLLNALGSEWRFDSLIHGDMKWDNVLVFPGAAGLDFRIVDWEMVDFGDAAWDVGAVLQSFLTVWIMSMPISSGLPPEAYVSMATQPLETMRPVLKAFWDAYAATRGYTQAERKSELERCMRSGPARLVVSALEPRACASQADPAPAALLQGTLNVLEAPARAVKDLLDA